MRGSTSSSMIGMGASRSKNQISASSGQAPRQSSYGPTGTGSNNYTPTGFSHLKQPSRDLISNEFSGPSSKAGALSSKRGSTRPDTTPQNTSA